MKKLITIILFSICRHIERKGLINLIESLKLLDKKNNNWHQYIAGVGPLTTKLKKKVNDLGLSQSITFLGRISESELHGCYKKSDIFLLPNMILDNGDADGCPVVFIEASAYGIPCIGGDVPGTQDAIIDGETGFIINSNNHELIKNKIDFLINNEDKRKNMGIQAKELILKSYKWEDRLELIRKVNDKISNK